MTVVFVTLGFDVVLRLLASEEEEPLPLLPLPPGAVAVLKQAKKETRVEGGQSEVTLDPDDATEVAARCCVIAKLGSIPEHMRLRFLAAAEEIDAALRRSESP